MYSDCGVEIPKRQTIDSAGYDFYMPYDMTLEPGKWYTIDTGIMLEENEVMETTFYMYLNGEWETVTIRPAQWVMKLYARSGLGNRNIFRFANGTGIIDQDYVGKHIMAKVAVDEPLILKKGDRYMQGIICPTCYSINEVIPTRERTGGHGSTGQ